MSSGTATIKGLANMEVSVTTFNALVLNTRITAINAINTTAVSFITSTGISAINVPHNLYANIVLTFVSAGNFKVQSASEVAASVAKLNAGTAYKENFNPLFQV